jgi:hypothetical protein
MPGCFLPRALCDGWTVEWRAIDALLVKCQLRRGAVIFAVERHGEIESRDEKIAVAIGKSSNRSRPMTCANKRLPFLEISIMRSGASRYVPTN